MSASEQRWVLVPACASKEMIDAARDTPGMQEVDAVIMSAQARNPYTALLRWTDRGEPPPLAQAYAASISAAPKPSEGDLERAARAAFMRYDVYLGYNDEAKERIWQSAKRGAIHRLRAALDALGGGE